MPFRYFPSGRNFVSSTDYPFDLPLIPLPLSGRHFGNEIPVRFRPVSSASGRFSAISDLVVRTVITENPSAVATSLSSRPRAMNTGAAKTLCANRFLRERSTLCRSVERCHSAANQVGGRFQVEKLSFLRISSFIEMCCATDISNAPLRRMSASDGVRRPPPVHYPGAADGRAARSEDAVHVTE
ncbi:hypothetical protein ACWFPY_34590 [Nocardia fluminea]